MSSMDDLNRLGRHLLGRPSLALRYEQQRMPANIRVSFYSDFEADRARRKATTGMFQRFGRHPIKTTSSMQTSVGLNVSECEFYVLEHGAYCTGLDFKPTCATSESTCLSSPSQTVQLGKRLCADEAWAGNDMFEHAICGSKTWLKQTVSRPRRYQQRTTSLTSRRKQSTAKASTKLLETMGFVEVQASKLHKQS